ncbi:MAG: CBS domain-containing protein, partial [Clostridia bacterium]|nr:CBS domain-containing protein [Clostridia bacterium]
MGNDIIYIFGHRHPDTDSICSSIAYADLKRKLGIDAEARRLGEINKETAFILDYFKLPVPPILETVKTQVCDLKIDRAEKLSPNTTIKKAWNIMERSETKTLPVVDDNEKLIGIVSMSDITEKYMDAFNYNAVSAYGTKLENILETVNADVAAGDSEHFEAKGKVIVAAGRAENLKEYAEPGDIVIAGDREDVLLEAIRIGAGSIIVTCAHTPPERVLK